MPVKKVLRIHLASLELLHVKRFDHGVRCLEDPKVVAELFKHQTPLTVCPLSNVKLKVFKKCRAIR